jgi:hypothetical protein
LAGFGQVRCGNGGGSWVVLGAQEKGSRASRGTIQFEMEVPNPLEWKGPWDALVFCCSSSYETHLQVK